MNHLLTVLALFSVAIIPPSTPSAAQEASVELSDTAPPVPRTISVHGIVLDEAGSPAAITEVQCLYQTEESGPMNKLSTVSNDDGSYLVSDVPIANPQFPYLYHFRVTKPRFAVSQQNRQTELLFTLAKEPNAKLEINFTLRSEVIGQVQLLGEDLKPLAGVALAALSSKSIIEDCYWFNRKYEGREIISDAEGLLLIPGLQAGVRYDLEFEHPDYANTPAWHVDFEADFNTGPVQVAMDRGMEVEFIVKCESNPSAITQGKIIAMVSEEGGYQRLVFPIGDTGTIKTRLRDVYTTIRVEHPTLQAVPWYQFKTNQPRMDFRLSQTGIAKGRVIDNDTEEGAARTLVQLVTDRRVIATGQTDADGYYEISIAAGSYTTSTDPFSNQWKANLEKHTVIVRAGEVTSVPDMTVTRIVAKAALKGRVVLPSGEPVAEAIVISNFRDAPVVCDQDGRFELRRSALFGSTIPIQVLHPHQRMSRAVSANLNSEEITIGLGTEGSVIGIVMDQEGKPLPNVECGVNGRISSTSTIVRRFQSKDDGTFEVTGLSPGYEYRIVVSGLNRSEFGRQVEVANPQFEIKDGSRIERNPLVVSERILNESDLRASYRAESISAMLPMENGRWLRESDPRDIAKKTKATLILMPGRGLSFENFALIKKIYADVGIRFITVLADAPYTEQEMTDIKEQISGPVLIDSEQAGLMRGYQVNMNDFPMALLFDSDNQLIWTARSESNLLSKVRNWVLYGE